MENEKLKTSREEYLKYKENQIIHVLNISNKAKNKKDSNIIMLKLFDVSSELNNIRFLKSVRKTNKIKRTKSHKLINKEEVVNLINMGMSQKEVSIIYNISKSYVSIIYKNSKNKKIA